MYKLRRHAIVSTMYILVPYQTTNEKPHGSPNKIKINRELKKTIAMRLILFRRGITLVVAASYALHRTVSDQHNTPLLLASSQIALLTVNPTTMNRVGYHLLNMLAIWPKDGWTTALKWKTNILVRKR